MDDVCVLARKPQPPCSGEASAFCPIHNVMVVDLAKALAKHELSMGRGECRSNASLKATALAMEIVDQTVLGGNPFPVQIIVV